MRGQQRAVGRARAGGGCGARAALRRSRRPAGGVGEVDPLEDRMQALAGARAAREAQDVVGGERPAAARRCAPRLSRDPRVVVGRRGLAARAVRQAAVAADAPGRRGSAAAAGSAASVSGATARQRRPACRGPAAAAASAMCGRVPLRPAPPRPRRSRPASSLSWRASRAGAVAAAGHQPVERAARCFPSVELLPAFVA